MILSLFFKTLFSPWNVKSKKKKTTLKSNHQNSLYLLSNKQLYSMCNGEKRSRFEMKQKKQLFGIFLTTDLIDWLWRDI